MLTSAMMLCNWAIGQGLHVLSWAILDENCSGAIVISCYDNLSGIHPDDMVCHEQSARIE